MQQNTRNLVLAGIFLAMALLLPFLTGQIPTIGNMLLPMHLPVLLCGFLCGWPYGLAVGALAPLLRSVIFGMPPLFPTAVAMAFELAAYGAVCGLMMANRPRTVANVLLALVISMLAGRAVWGLVSWALYAVSGSPFGWQVFFAGAFARAVPGILLQLVFVPTVVLLIWRAEAQKGVAG